MVTHAREVAEQFARVERLEDLNRVIGASPDGAPRTLRPDAAEESGNV
jgi:hypothetical protein